MSKNIRKVADHYSKTAKNLGFSARSVFKLEEIQTAYNILAPGFRVIDLGCSPGSWSQYTLGIIGKRGKMLGMDLTELKQHEIDRWITTLKKKEAGMKLEDEATDYKNRYTFKQGDVFKWEPEDDWKCNTNVVLSDMMSNTTGNKDLDCSQSCELCVRAMELASALLVPNGVLVVKVFQGRSFPLLYKLFQSSFKSVHSHKPKSSRPESKEIFLVGKKMTRKVSMGLWENLIDEDSEQNS